MPLTLNCPKCKNPFRVRDEALGQKVKCPSCGAILAVPSNIGPASIMEIPVEMDSPRPLGSVPTGPPPVAPRPVPESLRHRRDSTDGFPFEENAGPPEEVLASQPMPAGRMLGRPDRTVPQPERGTGSPKFRSHPSTSSIEFTGWKSVRGSLRTIQVAAWFAFLPLLYETGKWFYFYFAKVNPAEAKSLLGFAPMWTEITLGALLIPIVLAFLLMFLGRLGLVRVPPEAEARGLARGSMWMTLLSFIGLIAIVALEVVIAKDPLKGDLKWVVIGEKVSFGLLLFFGFVGEIWYLLFLAQISHPIGEPRLTPRIGGYVFFLTLFAVAPFITNEFYPLFAPEYSASKFQLSRGITFGAITFASFIVFLLYTRLAGTARRAIEHKLQDQHAVMVMSDR